MNSDNPRPQNRGWFRKGQSGNRLGRPKATRDNASTSPFDVVVEKTLTVTRNGIPREITMEEALQHRTYQDALAGKRMAIREVLSWILKRERWREKQSVPATRPFIFGGTVHDPDNADAAMLLLGIVVHNPARAGLNMNREQLLLAPWAVEAALRRRRGAKSLTRKELAEIRRCTQAHETLRLPEAGDE